MPTEPQLLEMLACPRCRGALSSLDQGRALLCALCKTKYPVQSGIPLLMVEYSAQHSQSDQVETSRFYAAFQVVHGTDMGVKFQVALASCKALGRAESSSDRTSMTNLDLTHALDDGTKALIQSYIRKQFRNASDANRSDEKRLGKFQRLPDLNLEDDQLSKLHAMIFVDEEGRVGILDLVSKNGTFVNGDEVESQLLRTGDVIEFGETKITFEGGAK